LLCEKDLPHNVQLYGFSPVWNLICFVRLWPSANDLSQSWQLYGFSPVWTCTCLARWLLWPKVLLHCWQLNNLVILIAGTSCSITLSAFVLSPSCSFLKMQKMLLKGRYHKLLVLFAFVSDVQIFYYKLISISFILLQIQLKEQTIIFLT
jgi:hypothetical protein